MLKDILKILENDAQATPKQISAMTGIPPAEVSKLIKQAEKDRIILKYKTIVNWDKAENEHIFAWIGVRLEPQKDVGFDSIAERIHRFPQARSVYLVSGTYDLLVLVIGKNNHEIANFVSQKLSHIEGVKETVTQFILKCYKEDGEVMESTEKIKRQAVVL
ncbi:MAG: Lrp/AsnC family transcriptional regulator [Dehalococcoidales bacterium]|nr:Lrp/AsnC family transcriptional regulator [Dehalococcoidales bacterium]